MIGELRIVEDVPAAFADVVADASRQVLADGVQRFLLGGSGSHSGRSCFERLAAHEGIDWGRLALYFVDERCVPADSPESNQQTLREALGARLRELAAFVPMSCTAGAAAYETHLAAAWPYHLAQLGMGADGHTASVFPHSPALSAAPDRLVVDNVDPSGTNVHPRLTLTLEALRAIPRLVVTVMGADKAAALKAVDAGDDLPATRIDSPAVLWLCEPAAAAALPGGR